MDVCPQLHCWWCVQKSLFKAFSRLVSCLFQYLILCSIQVLESLCAQQWRWGKSLSPGSPGCHG